MAEPCEGSHSEPLPWGVGGTCSGFAGVCRPRVHGAWCVICPDPVARLVGGESGDPVLSGLP